ncbi:hypothetical protein [Promicromonospora sp. NPDC023987]|uniref:hypothetical protein n=1 Tax=Promicromonospora sp. NPDC023987 TaxID=3155360 RepID=UPI0033F9DE3A
MSTDESEKQRLRWGWIALAALVGGAAIGWGWWLSVRGGQPEYWPGVLANLGTSVLLAGFLFLLERRFVSETGKVVQEATSAAVANAARDAAAQTQAATASLVERLSELEHQLDVHRSQAAADQDERLSIGDEVSYEKVFEAITVAEEMGAIIARGVVVPASGSLDGPRLSFSRQRTPVSNDSRDLIDGQGSERYSILLGLETGDVWNSPAANWSPEDSPSEAFVRLDKEMIRQGFGPDAKVLEPAVALRNLSYALKSAVAARRSEDGAWLSGASLLEVLADGWALTERGLEVKGHGVVVDHRRWPPATGGFWNPDGVPPTRPSEFDPATWDVALEHGHSWFPLGRPPF